jgi:hypothetical protein
MSDNNLGKSGVPARNLPCHRRGTRPFENTTEQQETRRAMTALAASKRPTGHVAGANQQRRPRRRRLPHFTDRLTIGRTEALSVSPFCVGMVSTPDAVITAFERGINFFFVTADMHWPLYEATREGLRLLFADRPGARDEIVVGVVSYATQAEFCWYPFDEVIEAIPGLDRIDLMIAGGAYGHEIPRRLEVYAAKLAHGHAGVRAIGVTFHDRAAAADCIAANEIDVAFIRYNAAHPGARNGVFERVHTGTRTRVIGFKSAAQLVTPERMAALGMDEEYWYPAPTDYYRFALTPPEMDGILCSPATPSQVHALERALALGPLHPRETAYLQDLARLDAARP